MLLSIIVPVYNVQKYLARCIDSVVKVGKSNVEVILVDDGSSDKSPEICDRYAKQYENIIVVHQQNGGLSVARNTGINVSSGIYIAFLDSDDMYESGFVNDMLNIIQEYKPDMISYHCCYEREENNFRIQGSKNIKTYTDIDYFKKMLQNKMGSQICFHVYKKKLFEQVRFPSNCHYEDIRIFWEIISCAKKIIDVDFTYYIYNLTNQTSITKNVSTSSMRDMKKSIDTMINGVIHELQVSNNFNSDFLEIANYSKLNGYIYIAYKLRHNQIDATELKSELNEYIKPFKVNLWKYRNYDWKKYLVYRFLLKLGKV